MKPVAAAVHLALALSLSSPALFAQEPLEIYWIDVEGGSATLIATPGGESVLMDAGWDRDDARDAERIMAAMRDAGLTDIDYFIASHFHGDHVGGTPAIASRVTIHQFLDHGDSVEQATERGRPAWEAYLSAAQGKRRTVRPGDTLPLTGVELRFVAANRELIGAAHASPNEHCGGPHAPEDLGENSRSVGYSVTLGEFAFLDLGDMTVDVQQTMACPANRLGVVDLLQVPHHGQGVAAELVWALEPTVAVSNNGATKGGRAEDLATVQQSPGLEGFWQVHHALASAEVNAAADMTANPTDDGDRGYWIKATVEPDGARYTITNARNGYSRTYATK